ncbi:hypothetical protein ACIOK4_00320 [Streptomyces bottropensis]|uniref:hypothetical protein n=1 Tax=Streptomyces bottropensis TaxID=42235 RepID=UPI003803530C
MTLTDASLFIAVVLGCTAAAVAIGALLFARHARFQGRASEPYAGFLTGAHSTTGELRWLACEGHCPGSTTHETAGDGEATCALCGTTRLVPAPDTA